MSQIVVEVELCKADRERLDAILAKLGALAAGDAAAVAPREENVVELAAQHPVETPLDPAPAPATAPSADPVSLAEFQKAITLRCAESQQTKEKVRALVGQYAKTVSGIPEDKRAEVLDKLAQI